MKKIPQATLQTLSQTLTGIIEEYKGKKRQLDQDQRRVISDFAAAIDAHRASVLQRQLKREV